MACSCMKSKSNYQEYKSLIINVLLSQDYFFEFGQPFFKPYMAVTDDGLLLETYSLLVLCYVFQQIFIFVPQEA